MWMAPEKREVNRKKGRDNRKKGRVGITPKPPETRASTGFAGCPRARARKNKKKQVKNPGAPGTGHPCGFPHAYGAAPPPANRGPQRGPHGSPGFAPCGLDQPPSGWTPAWGLAPYAAGAGGGLRPFPAPRLRLSGFRRRQGRYAPPTAVSPLTPTPPLGRPRKRLLARSRRLPGYFERRGRVKAAEGTA